MCTLHEVVVVLRGVPCVVLGDLVGVATFGIVPCVSKIDTLGLFHSLSLLKEKLN